MHDASLRDVALDPSPLPSRNEGEAKEARVVLTKRSMVEGPSERRKAAARGHPRTKAKHGSVSLLKHSKAWLEPPQTTQAEPIGCARHAGALLIVRLSPLTMLRLAWLYLPTVRALRECKGKDFQVRDLVNL